LAWASAARPPAVLAGVLVLVLIAVVEVVVAMPAAVVVGLPDFDEDLFVIR
jgi:hypothetical protein